MPRHKKDYKDDELPPAPDYQWFEEMAVRRGFGSIVGLSELVITGGDRNLLGRSLNRKRRLKTAELVRLAECLRTPVRVVLHRLGYDIEDPRAEVVGRLNGEGMIVKASRHLGSVPAPDYIDKLSAVIADTDGSPLSMWHDCIFYFVDTKEVVPDTEGQLSIIQIKERSARIVGYVRATADAKFVEPLGLDEKIPTKQVVASSPIRWIAYP